MLSSKLRFLRGLMNKSQKVVAKELGLEYKRYNHYETGRREPDMEMLRILADYFGVSTDYLLERDGAKGKPAIEADDGFSERLQAPYMQEIHDTLLKLKPETRKLILAQIEAAKAFEDDAKK